jgi:hypothetical protein
MHDEFDHDPSDTVFRDVILLALLGFVAIAILLLPHVNPKGRTAEAAVAPPGNVIVEIRWPDDLDTDVDLWVRAPGDVPVGYSNKGGLIFNLLRDDLGKVADPTDLNYEVAYSRGIPPGEYAVNLHLYRNSAGTYPVPVKVTVSSRSGPNGPTRHLVQTRADLVREGQELTAFRFKLTEQGELVPGSIHNLFAELRSARK